MSDPLYLAKSDDGYPALLPQMANRHGLITGARCPCSRIRHASVSVLSAVQSATWKRWAT